VVLRREESGAARAADESRFDQVDRHATDMAHPAQRSAIARLLPLRGDCRQNFGAVPPS
jgi:hypothetical protein